MVFTASVPPDQSRHCRADTAKGGELSYMALAMEREPTTYSSLLMLSGAVTSDSEPMLDRLVSDTVAQRCFCFSADSRKHASACRRRVKGGEGQLIITVWVI